MAENNEPLSVSAAVEMAKATVGSMPTLVVCGEVTGFRGPNARSGHCYFQVKDESSAMDAIVWRGTYTASGVQLKDGLEIQLTGKFDVYAGTGRLSFVAKRLEVAGEGLLRQQVAELARRLEREGLMDPARKRPIPRFCSRVAVVTSLSGSVIDDVKRTLSRRNPLVELQVAGCSVQGPGAPESIRKALDAAAAARPDAILLVRGGGSFEDLMTFNDEGLARAVAACPVPVITGIGHEPDTSICDMVSDRRCSTPTAAAESVAPAIDELASSIRDRAARLGQAMSRTLSGVSQTLDVSAMRANQSMGARLSRERMTLDSLAARPCLSDPASMIDSRTAELLMSEQRLHDAIPRALEARRRELGQTGERLVSASSRMLRPYSQALEARSATLEALSPLRVLSRGYAIVRDGSGHVVSSVADVAPGARIVALVSDGTVEAEVTATRKSE